MTTNFTPHCEACHKLPELIALATSIQVHDSRLEGLLKEIETLIPVSDPAGPRAAAPNCAGHFGLLLELQPRLQRIYESLLIEKHELRRSLSELEVLQHWTMQWTASAPQPNRSIVA